MKIYILADKDGKPKVEKRYKIPLTDRGGGNDEFEWDMVVFRNKSEMEKYILMGGETCTDTIMEIEIEDDNIDDL